MVLIWLSYNSYLISIFLIIQQVAFLLFCRYEFNRYIFVLFSSNLSIFSQNSYINNYANVETISYRLYSYKTFFL